MQNPTQLLKKKTAGRSDQKIFAGEKLPAMAEPPTKTKKTAPPTPNPFPNFPLLPTSPLSLSSFDKQGSQIHGGVCHCNPGGYRLPPGRPLAGSWCRAARGCRPGRRPQAHRWQRQPFHVTLVLLFSFGCALCSLFLFLLQGKSGGTSAFHVFERFVFTYLTGLWLMMGR